MEILKVSTEDPVSEQWGLLSRLTYPANIKQHLVSIGFPESQHSNNIVELIAGCMRQAQAYFNASSTAPLDISPLLLYYGATNLMMGALALSTNSYPSIHNHGMVLNTKKVFRVADFVIQPKNPKDGALHLFSSFISGNLDLSSGGTWTMGEILGSIPDLKHEFESHYKDFIYYVVPLETIYTRQRQIERIHLAELGRYADPEHGLKLVQDLNKAYLQPQRKRDYIILNPKPNGMDIAEYSISGGRYLSLGHEKNGRLISPSQPLLLLMGMFVLCSLTRYHPEFWNQFVRSDITGERYVIERFMSIIYRHFPNLILNRIFNKQMIFVNVKADVIDLRQTISEDDVKKILLDMRQRGEL